MTHRIIPRSEWGATKPNGSGPAPLPANGVRLHHSVTIAPDLVPPFTDDYQAIRDLERIGHARFGAGISYTFPITPAGLIFEGHSVDRKGTHTAKRNSVERAISFVGNYETDKPTAEMIDAAGWLLAHGFLSGWWRAAPLLGGHRDVKATACPGRHAYAAIGEINATAKRYVDQLTNPIPEPPKEWSDMATEAEVKAAVKAGVKEALAEEAKNKTKGSLGYMLRGISRSVLEPVEPKEGSKPNAFQQLREQGRQIKSAIGNKG